MNNNSVLIQFDGIYKMCFENENHVNLKRIKKNHIEINGVIDIFENPITINDFHNKFIKWVEYNKWQFIGDIKSTVK